MMMKTFSIVDFLLNDVEYEVKGNIRMQALGWNF